MNIITKVILVLVLDLLIYCAGNTQELSLNIEWDIQSETITGQIPADIPFGIKIKNVNKLKTCHGDARFFVWIRDNEKEIENDLTVKNVSFNFADKFNHSKSKLYYNKISTIDETTFYVESPILLKNDNIISFGIICETNILQEEINKIIFHFKENELMEKIIIPKYINGYKNSLLTNDNLKFANEYINNFLPTFLTKEIKSFNTSYKYVPSYFSDLFDEYFNTISTYLLNGIYIDSIHLFDHRPSYTEVLFYYNLMIKNKNNTITYDQFYSAFISLKSQLILEFSEVLKEVTIETVIAGTFPNKIDDRVRRKIISHVGFGFGSDFKKTYPYSTIGLNYFFYPLNAKVPISIYKNNILKRFSVHIASTFIDLNPTLIDNKKNFGLFNNQTLTLGLGYLIDDGILINFGALIYNKASENPLISQKRLNGLFNISLNVDKGVKEIFTNSLSKK